MDPRDGLASGAARLCSGRRAVSDRRMYFEDLSVGQRFGGTSYEIPHDEMLAYASKWAREAIEGGEVEVVRMAV